VRIDPAAVRSAWSHGEDADLELGTARYRVDAATDADLGPVSDVVTAAADRLGGLLDSARSLLAEQGRGLEASVSSWEDGDGRTARELGTLG
jgi:hypothetical protein